jgi:hypothetical protein
MGKALKTRASKLEFVSENQLTLPGFETPFEQNLKSTNKMGSNGAKNSMEQTSKYTKRNIAVNWELQE